MELTSLKHCRHIPVLQLLNKSVLVFVLPAVFLLQSCMLQTTERPEEIIKLLAKVEQQRQKLEAIDSLTLDSVETAIVNFRHEPSFLNDSLIQISLLTAEKAIERFKYESSVIADSLVVTTKQLSNLEEDFIRGSLTKEEFILYLNRESQIADLYMRQAEYLSSRFHAQKLLLETLEKERSKRNDL